MARDSRSVISKNAQKAGLYPVFTGFFSKPAMKFEIAL
jgi:hypothetical protein